jgi:[acyl-carrier-protein] S-malonyltransferase
VNASAAEGSVEAANYNAQGQVVIAGSTALFSSHG